MVIARINLFKRGDQRQRQVKALTSGPQIRMIRAVQLMVATINLSTSARDFSISLQGCAAAGAILQRRINRARVKRLRSGLAGRANLAVAREGLGLINELKCRPPVCVRHSVNQEQVSSQVGLFQIGVSREASFPMETFWYFVAGGISKFSTRLTARRVLVRPIVTASKGITCNDL